LGRRALVLSAEGAPDARLPPLFLPFHALVFASTGAGLAWLARLVPRACSPFRGARAAKKPAEVLFPPMMV